MLEHVFEPLCDAFFTLYLIDKCISKENFIAMFMCIGIFKNASITSSPTFKVLTS
jgi:hypothetical protein